MVASSNCGTRRSSITSPAPSWVSVVFPNDIVPEYSLSSLIRRSCTFVPRPIVISNSPVAIGSSVPQWPTFLICNRRLTSATTSCDVMSGALSTSRTPSGVAVNDIANCREDALLHFGKTPANARPGGQLMTAAAEALANCADVGRFRFGTHADTDFAIGQFFEKNRDHHAL